MVRSPRKLEKSTAAPVTPATPAAPAAATAAAVAAWWTNSFVDMSHMHCQALLSMQRSMLLYNKDLWEQWSVRYAGGCPIDG